MNIFKPFLLGMCAVLVLTGCATQIFVASGEPPKEPIDDMAIFFFGGVLQTQSVNAFSICGDPEEVSRVEFFTGASRCSDTLLCRDY